MNKYFTLLVFGGISFGTAAIFIKICDLSPSAIAFFRFLIAGLILSFGKINLKQIIKVMPFGFLLAIHMILFIMSVNITSIIDATVLVSTSPLFAILLYPLSKFTPSKMEIISALTAFLGVIILNYPIIPGEFEGNVFAIISAFMISLYTIFLSRKDAGDPISLTSAIYISSSIFMIPLMLINGVGKINMISIIALMGLIALPTLLGHTSVIVSSGHVKPHVIETIGLLEPVVATILAIIFFHQIPNIYEIIGSVIIVLSIFIILYRSS
ncbi:DMT family transporter [Acidianus brierleyi]|uniref:DMT family transporter n=1 Tax=Acidianus brierleyi TaxID=41673 RepID=UPI0014431A02|nr:DMT family transporter [Acidianus brierleyi]QIJ32834.1 EamA family transporter [Acidianus brierleyi]